jgi:hypothetical protein
MRAIVRKGLSIGEAEEFIATVWVAVEACGIASPTVSAAPQSATWIVQLQFECAADADRVAGKLMLSSHTA